MPQRSNSFQRLIAILHAVYDGPDEVVESAMLEDRVTGKDVEVDIVVRQIISGYPIVVSIECRAHKRRQGPGWVDEMAGKHSFLETDRLVLVSESGYTDSAYTKAKLIGVELLTLDEAVAEDWEAVHGELEEFRFEGHWVFPRRVTITIGKVWQPRDFTQGDLAAATVTTSAGDPICSLEELVTAAFSQMRADFAESTEIQQATIRKTVRPAQPVMIRIPDGPDLPLVEILLVLEEFLHRGSHPTKRHAFRELLVGVVESETDLAEVQLVTAGASGGPSKTAMLHTLKDKARAHCVWDVAIYAPGETPPPGMPALRPHDLKQLRIPKGEPSPPQIRLSVRRETEEE